MEQTVAGIDRREDRGKGDATYGFFPLCNPPSSLGRSELTSRMHEDLVIPPARPSRNVGNTTTVLAGKGALRRAQPRRALAHCAPLWAWEIQATGGSGGITRQAPMSAFGRQNRTERDLLWPAAARKMAFLYLFSRPS